MAVVDTTIYVSDDETLYKSTDGGDNWDTVSEGLTAGYQIKGLAAHGDLLYITANNGTAGEIETLTSGGTSTQKMSAAIYDKIFSVKNTFIVTIGNALHQYDGNTTVSSAIITLPFWSNIYRCYRCRCSSISNCNRWKNIFFKRYFRNTNFKRTDRNNR